MDWSVLHALNDFLFHHDQVEDPLLFYVSASEALFIATLALIFISRAAGAISRGGGPRSRRFSAPAWGWRSPR